jgi:choloylglycine hydrolase
MCTRIFWNRPEVARVVGRTLDWEVSDEPKLWHFPRGLTRNGQVDGAAEWVVEHRSLAVSFWDAAVTEGVNEAGLAAHLLYLAASDFGPRDDRPGVNMTLWAQYLLDRYATVAEALDGLEDVQIVQVPVRDQILGAHLALEDPSGDSAIVEFLGGRPVVHHGPEYDVMANDPTFDEQLAHRDRFVGFGGREEIPGNITSPERFVRASYFLQYLPTPATPAEAVAGVLGVARNVSVPFGAPYDDFSVYPTWWASVVDVTHRTLFFQSTLAPNVVWVELDGPALADCTEVRWVDPTDADLVGDVSDRLRPGPAPF